MDDDVTHAHLDAFGAGLLDWYDCSRRELPWRDVGDPYLVWVSEVMLQQTRVSQVRYRYERFTTAFPTIEALASAELDDVLRQWEGFGYYARARNLHAAARRVVSGCAGVLPRTLDGLRALPGIGPYTARAVLSLAFGEPYAAVDANVIRVLARVFGIRGTGGRMQSEVQRLADGLLSRERPAAFNQALMDLGATVCTPRSPVCATCPLSAVCRGFAEGAPEAYPEKRPKRPLPVFEIAVGLLFDARGRLLIQRRREDSMLGGLWEFPGGKREDGESLAETCRREMREEIGVDIEVGALLCTVRHAYSHFCIVLHAFLCTCPSAAPVSRQGLALEWMERERLSDFAFPRANRRILEILERLRLDGTSAAQAVFCLRDPSHETPARHE